MATRVNRFGEERGFSKKKKKKENHEKSNSCVRARQADDDKEEEEEKEKEEEEDDEMKVKRRWKGGEEMEQLSLRQLVANLCDKDDAQEHKRKMFDKFLVSCLNVR